jgi:K+-sensing histidine kinase KdpD
MADRELGGGVADSRSESLFFLGVGPLAAVVLGILLIPFREITTASNLTFLFLALVIIVAEVSGRRAAVATAISSSMSVNFFLTEPYLRLTIHSRDDVIAVLGLAICGLIAASFGSRGGEWRELAAARAHGAPPRNGASACARRTGRGPAFQTSRRFTKRIPDLCGGGP